MIVDRFTKAVLTVIALALVAIAARPWVAEHGWLDAARPSPAYAQNAVPKYDVVIPREWGKFIGYASDKILLEAPDHSLRVVDVEGKAPEYPRIKALIRWQ